MKIKFNKSFGILLLSSFMTFSMAGSTFAMKSAICHKTGGCENFLRDGSFKCFKCDKWFDDRCLNALLLTFGGKPSPKNYICWKCSGFPEEMPLLYDENGFDRYGYDKFGFDINGFSKDGVNKDTGRKWDTDGYDVNGFNRRGIHKITGAKFNPQGFDQNGCDITGKPVLKKNMYRFVGNLD